MQTVRTLRNVHTGSSQAARSRCKHPIRHLQLQLSPRMTSLAERKASTLKSALRALRVAAIAAAGNVRTAGIEASVFGPVPLSATRAAASISSRERQSRSAHESGSLGCGRGEERASGGGVAGPTPRASSKSHTPWLQRGVMISCSRAEARGRTRKARASGRLPKWPLDRRRGPQRTREHSEGSVTCE